MNKKTGIIAIVAVLLIAGLPALAGSQRINWIDFTPASEVRGGLQPGMTVSVGLPPYDTFAHVAYVQNGSVFFQGIPCTVATPSCGLTTTNGTLIASAALDKVYFVSSPYFPGSLPASPP